jgi:hypothetical protein
MEGERESEEGVILIDAPNSYQSSLAPPDKL